MLGIFFGDWPPVLQGGGASGVPFRVASPMWRVATTATPELPFIRHPTVGLATLFLLITNKHLADRVYSLSVDL